MSLATGTRIPVGPGEQTAMYCAPVRECDGLRECAIPFGAWRRGTSALSRNNRSRLVRLPGDLRAAQGHGDGRARRCGHTRAHHRRASAHRRAAPEFIQASSKLQASSPLRQAPQGGAASEPEESLLGLMGARVGARARAGPAAYSRVRGWSLAAVTPLPHRHGRRADVTHDDRKPPPAVIFRYGHAGGCPGAK